MSQYLTSVYQQLSVTPTTVLNVDEAYIGQTFGVVYSDNSSAQFTVLSGNPVPQLSSTGYFGASDNPEFRRLWNLNG